MLDKRFDGDTASFNCVYSDEAVAELKRYLNTKAFYINSSGQATHSCGTETVNYVLKNMTCTPTLAPEPSMKA